MRVLMWEDMFRRWDAPTMKRLFRQDEKAFEFEPCVWEYSSEVSSSLGEAVFSNLDKVFARKWCASAYKGGD